MSAPTSLDLPRLIGHRGAAGLAPENTLAGIRVAATLGLRWVELDVRQSADGVPVLVHDDELARTTDAAGPVHAAASSALARADAGGWFGERFAGEPVPTVEQVCTLCSELDLGANFELKAEDNDEHAVRNGRVTAEALRASWDPRLPAPLLSSFADHALEGAAAAAPEIPRALLSIALPPAWERRLEELGCSALHLEQAHWTREAVGAVAERGYRTVAYTVNDPARAAELWSWGMDTVITDYPDRFATR